MNKFDIKFKHLPEVLVRRGGLVHVTQEFAYLYDLHGEAIKRAFEDEKQVRVSHRFPDGTPCRSELLDTSFLLAAESELSRRFNSVPHPTNGRAVYRLSNPTGLPEPTKQWVSESWHIDNFDNNGFKLIVYCSHVNDDTAPFEYQEPPTFVPVLPRNTTTFVDTRLNYIGRSKRVLGNPGTAIMFKNSNVPHKGNYCRRGIRDVIVFHFLSI